MVEFVRYIPEIASHFGLTQEYVYQGFLHAQSVELSVMISAMVTWIVITCIDFAVWSKVFENRVMRWFDTFIATVVSSLVSAVIIFILAFLVIMYTCNEYTLWTNYIQPINYSIVQPKCG